LSCKSTFLPRYYYNDDDLEDVSQTWVWYKMIQLLHHYYYA